MALVLKIGSLDLSSYLRVAHDEGLDPTDSAFAEPQYTGSPAFSEGQAGVGEALGNREQVYPLILKAADSTALHQLVRDINTALVRGAQVEYSNDSANASTFFDLEGGKFNPEYQFWITKANRLRGTLNLSVRPFGHTGTTRIIASAVSATGVADFPATGVLGDVAAQAYLLATCLASSPATEGNRVVMYGAHRSPSFRGVLGTPTLSGGTYLVVGASGRIGSQYHGAYVSPTSTSDKNVGIWPIPSALRQVYTGRYRALAVLKSQVSSGGTRASLQVSGPLASGARALLPTAVMSDFQLFDLGDLSIPSAMASQVAESYITLTHRGASGASCVASPAILIDQLVLLPLDISAGAFVRESDRRQWGLSLDGVARRVDYFTEVQNEYQPAQESFRGAPPALPPVGSGVSGVANMTVVAGANEIFAARRSDWSVGVRERFRYLR